MINVNESFSKLANELIPDRGKCDTLAGEVLRAAGRLQYDFYNNGMGNNTSGAIHFLDHHGVIKTEDFQTVYPFTRGRIYNGRYENDVFHKSIDSIVESAVLFVLNNPATRDISNEEDMFDFEEEEQHFCESCNCEIDYGWMCEDCEEDGDY